MRQEQTINIDMGGEKGGSKRGLTFWRPNTRPIFYPSVCRLRIAVWKHSALGRGCFRFNVCWWKNNAKERKMALKELTELAISCVWSIILSCIWQLSALGPSARAKPPCQDSGAGVTGSFHPPGLYREEWHRDRKGPLDVSKRKRRGSEYLSKLPTVCCP